MTATLAGLLAVRAVQDPEAPAIEMAGGGVLNRGDWLRRARGFADRLIARGAAPGDRIVLHFDDPEWIEYAVAFLGVLTAGCVAVPVSARVTSNRLLTISENCDARIIVRAADLTAQSVTGIEAGARATEPLAEPDLDALAQILYTSGTTGTPKGVAATHRNLVAGLRTRPRPLSHSELFLHSFPIGSNAAQTVLFTAVVAKPPMLVLPRFSAEAFGELVASRPVGTVFVVPAMAGELVNEKIAERFDTSGVVLVGSTAAALPPAVAAGLARQFPNADVVNTYTSTEAAPAQTMMLFDPSRPGSVGRPAEGEVRVTDSLGRPSPPGQTGDVWLRTGAATRAYFGDPQASAAVFADGWTRMGDIGRMDEDGYLHLVDRETDLITSGAYKISTLAVEDVLYGYPGVREAAVVGVPHPVMGQMVAAVLVADDDLDLSALRAHVAGRLPRHEVPTRYLFVERIPRNAGGKPVKDELRRMFRDDSRHLDSGRSTVVGTPLAKLWGRVLRLRHVPSDADFFALGGDSLRGTQLAMLVTEELRAPVGSSFVFDHPLLADQERQIAAVTQVTDARSADGLVLDTAADSGPPPTAAPPTTALVPAAEHFVGWMREHPALYPEPISIALRIRDRLDEELVRATMAVLLQRHTALRTVLDPVTSAPVVLDEGAAEVVWIRCAPDQVEAHAVAAVERRFDPCRGPLIRVHVLRTAAEDHVLVLVVDHLVFDGWSLGILLREFGLCYDALRRGSQPTLPPLPDAAAYQRWITAQYSRTVPRWTRHLEGAPRSVLLPGQRADVRQCVGAVVTRELPPAFGDRWRRRAAACATTPFVVGLAAWADVLTELSGEPEVVLWAALAGRLTPESESLVGPYPMVPYLRLQAGRGAAFADLVAAARGEVDFAVDNQCYPYERFRPAVRFAGAFAYEKWGRDPHIPGMESERFPLPQGRTMMTSALPGEADLTGTLMRVYERADGGIEWRLLYNSAALDMAAVTRVEAAFHDRLQEVL